MTSPRIHHVTVPHDAPCPPRGLADGPRLHSWRGLAPFELFASFASCAPLALLSLLLAAATGVACSDKGGAPPKAGGRETAPTAAPASGAAASGKAAQGEAKAGGHDDGDEHADDEHAGGEEDTLQIDADTLRDLRITIVPVETRAAAETLTLLGELGVNEEAYAEVSAPLPARVTRLIAAAGDDVRAGQALVVLQSREIGEALGALHGATARVTLARQALERKRTLAAERITPQRSVEEAEAELIAAEAAERTARASLNAIGVAAPAASRDSGTPAGSGREASGVTSRSVAGGGSGRDPGASVTSGTAGVEASRGDARQGRERSDVAGGAGDETGLVLRAPVGGTVLERTVAIGQLADPARPLFRVAHLGTLWLTVHAFERDAVRLSRGTAARVSFAALPGETFAGTIARVGQQVDPTSRTVAVRIDLPNPQRRLKPGMSASAAVPIGTRGERVLTVPAAALQRVRERWCVFVPEATVKTGSTTTTTTPTTTTRFHIRTVARGRELDGEVEILDGLSATDRVVSDGAFVLKAELDKRAGSGDAHAH
jgi:membrane fusion protein, heavy metal efflux system